MCNVPYAYRELHAALTVLEAGKHPRVVKKHKDCGGVHLKSRAARSLSKKLREKQGSWATADQNLEICTCGFTDGYKELHDVFARIILSKFGSIRTGLKRGVIARHPNCDNYHVDPIAFREVAADFQAGAVIAQAA